MTKYKVDYINSKYNILEQCTLFSAVRMEVFVSGFSRLRKSMMIMMMTIRNWIYILSTSTNKKQNHRCRWLGINMTYGCGCSSLTCMWWSAFRHALTYTKAPADIATKITCQYLAFVSAVSFPSGCLGHCFTTWRVGGLYDLL